MVMTVSPSLGCELSEPALSCHFSNWSWFPQPRSPDHQGDPWISRAYMDFGNIHFADKLKDKKPTDGW